MTNAARKALAAPLGQRLFYGWVIVAVAFLIDLIQSVAMSPVLGVFMKPMGQEFGWSRGVMSGAVSVGSVAGALVAIAMGQVVDRKGVKPVVLAGVVLMGVATAGLSMVHTLWQFYLFYSLARVVGSGLTGFAVSVGVATWFIRQRGRAMGLASLGHRLGNGFWPLVVQLVVGWWGWRSGWMALAAFSWGLGILPTVLFMRRRPEDMGLKPDGDGRAVPGGISGAGTPPAVKPEQSLTLGEAARTRAFYLLIVAACLYFLTVSAVNLHQVPHMMDVGIPAGAAVFALSIVALVGAVAQVFWAMLAERVPLRYTMAMVFALGAIAMFALIQVRSMATAYAFAVMLGISLGGGALLVNVAIADYFGRVHLGSIRGVVSISDMIALAVGPTLAGVVFDSTGSYTPVFVFFLVADVLAAVSIALAGPPPRKPAAAKSRG